MSIEKIRIAKRVAREMKEGYLVNLGIGLPTMVADYIGDTYIILQSENGMINMGPAQHIPSEHTQSKVDTLDRDISNAGGMPVQISTGGAFFDSAMSFAIIRGGHVDVTVLGAFEVDEEGSIASYIVPGKSIAGMGGAMDLLAGSKKVIVTMLHTNKGAPKILKKCSLPLTAHKKVDMVITEMGVLEYREDGLTLVEKYKDYSVKDILNVTDANIKVADDLRDMED